MCPLAMSFEGIIIKELIGSEGTQQLHAQMGLVQMRTDGSPGG